MQKHHVNETKLFFLACPSLQENFSSSVTFLFTCVFRVGYFCGVHVLHKTCGSNYDYYWTKLKMNLC